jgi:C-terminal processing protease CtpA/Prc
MRIRSLHRLPIFALIPALLIAACSGGSSPPPSGGGGIGGGGPIAGPSCSLRARQDWAAAQIREWYLFPETLPASLDPGQFTTVQDYIDALTATARAQGKDRFFTAITSIAEENAFFSQGQTAAFGIRIQYDNAARRAFVADAFEGAPALAAGIDRGAEILAIGTSPDTLQSVSSLFVQGGSAAVSDAFGPSTAGVQRTIRFLAGGVTQTVTITKTTFNIQPVSPRYGVRVIQDGLERVGYINLRSFISSADPQLRAAFADLRAQGINRFVIDFRYNGGGLVSIAELMGNLLGGNRLPTEIFAREVFRPEKSSNNVTIPFRVQPQSVSPLRIAFIGTDATASASEFVINGFIPFFQQAPGQNASMALIGGNTFGKPVGQIARDRAECDDRLRITAFATQNGAGQGDYYNGLAARVPNSCVATDDLSRPLGDAQETSTARALDFLNGRVCVPIDGVANTADGSAAGRQMLRPARPTLAQQEVPGLY